MKNGYVCCKLLFNRLLRFVAGRKEVDGISGDKKIVILAQQVCRRHCGL